MSQIYTQTIYELVDEICCRDFTNILGKLTQHNKDKFVEMIYESIMSGDNPEKITEQDIYDYVCDVMAKAVFIYLDDVVDVIK